MFWPWMPPGAACWPGGRSSGTIPERVGAAPVVVLVDEPPAGADCADCAKAPPASADVRTAAASSSRYLGIVVLPHHGPHLHLLLPAVAVARAPARNHEGVVGALVGGRVALDALGRLVAL